eukprot:scaffold19168_cov107-Isochrysis_galbana.AAC.9
MARHRLARIPLIGATRGTRLAQVFAPLINRQKSQLGSSRFYWEDGNVCVAIGRRNPPRL